MSTSTRTVLTSQPAVPDVPPTTSSFPIPSTPASSQPPTPSTSSSGKTQVGGIVGALFGGFVAGALTMIAIFFYLRSRRRRDRNSAAVPTDESAKVEIPQPVPMTFD